MGIYRESAILTNQTKNFHPVIINDPGGGQSEQLFTENIFMAHSTLAWKFSRPIRQGAKILWCLPLRNKITMLVYYSSWKQKLWHEIGQWKGSIFGLVSFVPKYNFWHNGLWMGWIQESMKQGSSPGIFRSSRRVMPRGRTKKDSVPCIEWMDVVCMFQGIVEYRRGGVSNKPTLGSGQRQDTGQGSFGPLKR